MPATATACRHCGGGPVNRPRGLCWRCYYTPGVLARHPRQSRRSDLADGDHRAAARLELLAAFLSSPRTGWRLDEWAAVLGCLPGQQQRVVVLKLLHGLPDVRIGELMGHSRARPGQLFDAAVKRLARCRPDLALEA